MAFVNEDIVEYILDSYDHWWPRDLFRLALVSSARLQPVRKHLYASPFLSSYGACHHLARTLEENRAFVALVRGLDLRPIHAGVPDDMDVHPVGSCPCLPRLLALSTLQRLVLGGDLSFHAERYLRAVANPHTVKALEIIGQTSLEVISWTAKAVVMWDGELATRFRCLESLALRGCLFLHIDDMHYEYQRVVGGDSLLKELVVTDVDFTQNSGPLCSLLQGPTSWQGLRTFTFTIQCYEQFNAADFVSMLVLVHESLEQLAVFDIYPEHSELDNILRSSLREVPPLRRLRTLRTSFLLVHDDFRHITANLESLDIAGNFCADHLLKWASYIDPDPDSLSEGQNFIFPKLRKMTVCLDDCTERRILSLPREVFSLLATACEKRGIELEHPSLSDPRVSH